MILDDGCGYEGAWACGSLWAWIPVSRVPCVCDARVRGFPKFTNEVQHFIEVLPWDSNGRRHDETNGRDGNHPSRIGVRDMLS